MDVRTQTCVWILGALDMSLDLYLDRPFLVVPTSPSVGGLGAIVPVRNIVHL